MEAITEITMTLKKSTKGTHVYGAQGSAVPSIYIKKNGLPSPAPQTIVLRIEVPEA